MRIALLFSLLLLAGCAGGGYVDRDPGALKSLPEDKSFHALFLGNYFKGYLFFEGRQDHPFWPDVREFDVVNAWWCAEASLLVYVPDERFVRERLVRAGFNEVTYYDEHGPALGPDMQFFVAARKEFVLVSFRGSEPNLADWVTNAKFGLVPFGSGNVHRGFLQALNDAWDRGALGAELERLRKENPQRPVWFCGHSLGGAVAVLAAARWFEQHAETRGGVYMFGAPRVGDREFCHGAKFPIFRVVNDIDLVASVPPLGPYGEIGELRWIGENSDCGLRIAESNPKAPGRVKALRKKWGWLPEDVVDHSPLLYAILEYNNSQN